MATPVSLENVRHVVLILLGKGGVGKSSVTTQTALNLVEKGFSVGVLDIDLTGPSLPRMFGVETQQVKQSTRGWVPVLVDKGSGNVKHDENDSGNAPKRGFLQLMSLGFLIGNRGNAVVWRGPKKTAMIRQFLKDVVWGLESGEGLDYLLIDTPPGTLDEHIAIAEELRWANPDGAIIVTTPQQVATADVRKEINFCRKVNFDVLGIVENMSGFICPHCSECTNIFLSGGGLQLSEQLGIPFLGNIPIDPTFVEMVETQQNGVEGKSLIDMYQKSELRPLAGAIVQKVLDMKIKTRQERALIAQQAAEKISQENGPETASNENDITANGEIDVQNDKIDEVTTSSVTEHSSLIPNETLESLNKLSI